MPKTVLPDVEMSEPLLTPEQIQTRLRALLMQAEADAMRLGGRLDPRDRQGIAARLHASEEVIGPVTPAAVAGWFRRHVRILPKSGGLVPFAVNRIQFALLTDLCNDIAAGRPMRYVLLKARQFGLSTLCEAVMFFFAHRFPSRGGAVVAHIDDATRNLYAMFARACDGAPFQLRVESRNSTLIHFADPTDVRINFATAEAGEVKRSYTLHWLHLSELAFWTKADKADLGLMQGVPDEPLTFIAKESTANGVGNLFWRQYWDAKEGRSSYRARFYPWFISDEYRRNIDAATAEAVLRSLDDEERVLVHNFGVDAGQLAWRRETIADKCDGDVRKFHQEYPSTDREAFLVSGRPVFSMELVEQRAERAKTVALSFQGALAYTGDDAARTAYGD